MVEAFIHGFILSLGLILPLGPQNLFIFNQGITQPTIWKSTPSILTASICDTILIIIAVLGVATLVNTIGWLYIILYVSGVLFLIYIGVMMWRETPSSSNSTNKSFSIRKQIAVTSSISLLNPHAILDTFAVIGSNALLYIGDGEQWVFALACILVSWFYFIFLALLGRFVGKFDNNNKLRITINKISSIMIFGIAMYMSIQFLIDL